MQYQRILIFLNISIIVLIFIFFRDSRKRRLLIISTICAYMLAAFLPYLLAWTSLNLTILFYTLAIGIVFVLAYYQHKSMENPTNTGEIVVAPSEGEASIAESEVKLIPEAESMIQLEMQVTETFTEKDSIIMDETINLAEVEFSEVEAAGSDENATDLDTYIKDESEDTLSDINNLSVDDTIAIEIPPNQIEIIDDDQLTEDEFENREIPEEILTPRDLEPATMDLNPITDDIEKSNVGEVDAAVVTESLNTDVQVDVEQLIIESFEARANGNFYGALTILETILEQDPPEEIVNLILDDIEILFAKLAS